MATTNLIGDAAPAAPVVVAFESRLDADVRWALDEGSLFFDGKGSVQEAFRKVIRRLNELRVEYAVTGGMAYYLHGFRRFTETIEILVTREGLRTIHQSLAGHGYCEAFVRSKHLRDADFGVQIRFSDTLDQADKKVELQSAMVLALPMLVSKLASGMRLKDLADVQELIKHLKLERRFCEYLNGSSQVMFLQLWDEVHSVDPCVAEQFGFSD